jgi:F0F1-type ATP synthase membrane subunit b/b'
MLDSYRQHPGQALTVSLEVGVTWATAVRAWNNGWPRKYLWPIMKVLKGEGMLIEGLIAEDEAANHELEAAKVQAAAWRAEARKEARSELAQASAIVEEKIKGAEMLAKRRLDELLAKANVGILEAKVDRMKMVRDARRSAGALLDFVAELYRDYKELRQRIMDHLELLEPKEIIAFMTLLSRMTKDAIECAQMAMALEDREYGRPDVIVAHTQLALPEALAEIDEAKSLADLIRQGEQPLLEGQSMVLDAGEL